MKAGRYEIREILGEGGMGIVYQAWDPVMKREVTVKTIRDPQDKVALEMFERERAVLASMTHPNIIEILDIGDTDEGGIKRPYFVMPLLPGVTLQRLIDESSVRLTVERCLEMIGQVCRGLQAAHENGLVHRDLKPSNLFVLPDDTVKIIDFGMAHLTSFRSITGLKGTPSYMAPEQVMMKQPTPLSDQFSLAVVCYQMLARRHPFFAAGQEDLRQAILRFIPPPVSEFNPQVSPAVSQVIHKALAKEPFHRFSSVREFSESLQKALRGETIEIFDAAKIAPRLQQARKAFESDDLDDADEIVKELESESYLSPEIGELRKRIDKSRRERTIKQLLETARRRLEQGEYVRALQKVQEILDLDPANMDAFTLKGGIERKRSATQIEDWMALASQHLENHSYAHARQALEKVLDIRPKEARARALLAEVERREHEHARLGQEKQVAYASALDAYQRGDINSALTKLERVLDLDRRAPSTISPDQGAKYQRLYEEVRSRRDQLGSQETEARRHLHDHNFVEARAICEQVLAAFPNNVLFRVLHDDIEQAERQEVSAFVANVEKEVAAESDLNRKVSILEEAAKKYPAEPRFAQSLQQFRSRRDLVDSIAGRARNSEELRQFSDALGQWEMLRSIYSQYPGLDVEIDRLRKRREQQVRADSKAHWVTQIEQAHSIRNYAKATALLADALVEFPGDQELAALAKRTEDLQTRASDAEEKANQGQELYRNGQTAEGLELLREAFRLDGLNPLVRSRLLDVLVKDAGVRMDADWRAAEALVHEALELDASNVQARSAATLIQDRRQEEEVAAGLSRARELQSHGANKDAIAELDKVRARYPRESRLIQLRGQLQESLAANDREELRARDLKELSELVEQSRQTSGPELDSLFRRTELFAKYEGDAEFSKPISEIEERVRHEEPAPLFSTPSTPSTPPVFDTPIPAPQPSEERASAGFLGRMPKLVWAFIGFAIVVLGLVLLIRNLSSKRVISQEKPVLSSVKIAVANAAAGEYTIKDKNGADVTLKSSIAGLDPGDYQLRAAKPGFRAATSFTIDPSSEPQKTLTVPWDALPAAFRLKLPRAAGSLKIDGQDQTPGADGDVTGEWHNGPHAVAWSTPDANVEVRFEVKDTTISTGKPVVRGDVLGMVAAVSDGAVTYQTINVAGGVSKTVGDQSEPLGAAGTFPLQPGQTVVFKAQSGPWGTLRAEPSGQPAIYAYLGPWKRAKPAGIAKPSSPKETPLAPIPPPPPESPSDADKAKRDELKRQYLERELKLNKGAQKQ